MSFDIPDHIFALAKVAQDLVINHRSTWFIHNFDILRPTFPVPIQEIERHTMCGGTADIYIDLH